MDLEILKSQIFAAIQAHTEGSLPVTWDKVADKLSRQAIEHFLRTAVLERCRTDIENSVMSSCLIEHASELASDLDSYIEKSLIDVFETLDRESLPKLLQHTAEDLRGILKYFNSVFLQGGNRRFTLEVIPWNEDPSDIHSFKSRLLNIAIHPSHDHTEITHSRSFFETYASMARY
ncbi:hypothetical protein BDB01DRAFT_714356 [Pilobolus umbonatus]|nr:hypothetical protein BDB01DRAFT_714356 [Pilobolus umbonatus]